MLKLYRPLSIMICAIPSNGLYRRNGSDRMLVIPPKEIDGKLKFGNNDVFIEEGVTLTEHEMELYRQYREELHRARSIQFEED